MDAQDGKLRLGQLLGPRTSEECSVVASKEVAHRGGLALRLGGAPPLLRRVEHCLQPPGIVRNTLYC
eukprot:5157443-Amphidinium_carterae.1